MYILLFADDIQFMDEDEAYLQILLDFANDWCRKWKMTVNNSTTKFHILRKKRERI